ncbi:MAG: SpoIIE family protein phosphatase [Eubacteriales bacterium]|nr:SpoIIE family protein phosphatase [Eubacteriales bacterium]
MTEATNAAQQLYGEERLAAVLNANRELAPEELLPAVRADVEAFVGQAPQFDDITVLGIRYNGQSPIQ